MMNGLLKVPMQFIILLVGVMVFVFYQFYQPPIFFNETVVKEIKQTESAESFKQMELGYSDIFDEKKVAVEALANSIRKQDEILISRHVDKVNGLQEESEALRENAKELIRETMPEVETNDKDYIFMNFVMNNLPIGIIGLLFAVIFSAAMSSTSSELNALGSTTTIDLYKRSIKKEAGDKHYLTSSKLFTLSWGILAIIFASYLSLFENLIQAVNLIGSLFYPTVLGIFVVGFFLKNIGSNAVFISAIISQFVIIIVHYLNTIGAAGILTMGYLWYNAFGCMLVVAVSFVIQQLVRNEKT